MPTLCTLFGDLCGSRRGCVSSGSADFRAISHDFGREILRPRFSKVIEIFGPKSAVNRMQPHAPQQADALHTVWGPLRVAARLRVVWPRGFSCGLARSRTRNFAAAIFFRKFRSEIRRESHKISRAAAFRRSTQCPGTSTGRGEAVRHQAARISARSRAVSNANFCRREKFSKNFGPKFVLNRVQSHAPQHAEARQRCWGPLRVVARLRVTKRHGFRRDLAR